MFFKGLPFSDRSEFWPKNLQQWPQKSIKIRSKIDQKNDLKNDATFIEKMTPNWPPKGPQNRLNFDLGATLGPKMGPGCSKRASETQFGRFLIDFGPILEQFLTNFWQNFDRKCTEFGSYFDETKLYPFQDMPVWAKAANGLAGLAERLEYVKAEYLVGRRCPPDPPLNHFAS